MEMFEVQDIIEDMILEGHSLEVIMVWVRKTYPNIPVSWATEVAQQMEELEELVL